ncbi:hypothetical protein [Longimicrobium sp.]|uniref:hypothetical protein n=1 Tax=Longimicrobium sp. TaxID=2029185 RepID=UPI003B3B6CB4
MALVLTACDLPNPAGSVHVSPTAESRAESAVLLGAYAAPNRMPVPGESPTSEVRLEPTSIPPLQPNSYVLLRISGTLEAVRNPYLGGSAGQGHIERSYSPVESTESTGRGATNVWLRLSPSNLTRISYFFRPAANGSDLVLMVRTGAQPTEVWAERERMPGAEVFYYYCRAGKPYCTPDGPDWIKPDTSYRPLVKTWLEDHWVVSSHVVTATAIAEPLIMDGPTSVALGETAVFTARPWGDLRLRYPHGQPGDVQWMWYPTDTTGTASPLSRAEQVCSGRPVCEFEPKVSGRLHVSSYVEGAPVETDRIVRVQKHPDRELRLECNGARGSGVVVRRGGTIACAVASDPLGGKIEVEKWWFSGVDSRGQPYQFPTEEDSPEMGLSWSGQLAISGTIHVLASIDGAPAVEQSVSVQVEARDWSDEPIKYEIRRGTLQEYNAVASVGEIVGAQPLADHDLGRMAAGGSVYVTSDVVDYIDDYGPNHRLAFLKAVPIELELLVMVHPEMENRGAFYRRQAVTPPAFGAPCLQRGFSRYVEQILAHEGFPVNPNAHTGVYLREYRSRAGRAVEDLVAPNDALPALGQLALSRLNPVGVHADAVSDYEVDTNHPVRFGCTFRWR